MELFEMKPDMAFRPQKKTGILSRSASHCSRLAKRSLPGHISFVIVLSFAIAWTLLYLNSYRHFDAFAEEREDFQSTYTDDIEQIQLQADKYRVQMDEYIGQVHTLQKQVNDLKAELKKVKSDEANAFLLQVNNTYDAIDAIEAKAEEYKKKGVLLDDFKEKKDTWKDTLYERDLKGTLASISEVDKNLDAALAKILSERDANGSSSHSEGSVKTERGTFSYTLIKAPIEGTHVETVSSVPDDCKNDCHTDSLANFVKKADGFAGIQGTYFCPPEYEFCHDQVNFTFSPIFDSADNAWIDWDKRLWNYQSSIVFAGNVPKFYANAADIPAEDIGAGIVNYPGLVDAGNIMANEDNTDRKQKIKATRGALGFDDQYLYLVVIREASVIDAAVVMRDLGARSALSLDGGGSAALYQDGKYLVGPGRPIPNAIVLTN